MNPTQGHLYIEKQHFLFRKAIPASEKLAATLRYLATGESMKSIHFQFRHGQETVRTYIPVVCKAIYDVLKDTCLQVSC